MTGPAPRSLPTGGDANDGEELDGPAVKPVEGKAVGWLAGLGNS